MTTILDISENVGPVSVLTLTGKIDGSTFQTLIDRAEKVATGGNARIVLDMSGVAYMSSAGLVALQSIHNRLRQMGGRLAVASLVPDVARVVELTGPPDWLNVYPSVAAARASFK